MSFSILLSDSFLSNKDKVKPNDGDLVEPVKAILIGWLTSGTFKLLLA